MAWKVPYGLDLTVQLEMPSTIRSVESPSHPICFEPNGQRGTVKLGERVSALDRDFVLLVNLAEPYEPRAWVEEDEKGCAAMVAFQPKFDVNEASCELIFVVDRSGSMGGTSMMEARNALQLCLRSLSEGTHFNIVGFGSSFEMLFPESRPYDDESLTEASHHVKQLRADLGGTELLSSSQVRSAEETQSGAPSASLLVDRRPGLQYRSRDLSGADTLGYDPRLHIRYRCRCESPSRSWCCARRRRRGRAHLPG